MGRHRTKYDIIRSIKKAKYFLAFGYIATQISNLLLIDIHTTVTK